MSKPAPYDFREALRCRLSDTRRLAALTQQELADGMGVHVKTVSSIEQGIALPAVRTVILWAQACGASLDELLGGLV